MLARVNGTDIFYTQTGQGPPILLLHGNGEDHAIFDELAARLSPYRTVIAADSRDHGQSMHYPPDAPLNYSDMAEDMAALLVSLGAQGAQLIGFSDGAILGLLIAIAHPSLLSRMVLAGANTTPKGVKAIFRISMSVQNFFRRNKLLTLMLTQPNITAAQMASISIPALVTAGEKDVIPKWETEHIANSIPNSTLKIIAGQTHTGYVKHSDMLIGIAGEFLGLPENA